MRRQPDGQVRWARHRGSNGDRPEKQAGGLFEYVPNLRNADAGDMNYEGVAEVLGGQAEVTQLAPEPGTLLVFRGRNSIHRVSPNAGARTRMLAGSRPFKVAGQRCAGVGPSASKCTTGAAACTPVSVRPAACTLSGRRGPKAAIARSRVS